MNILALYCRACVLESETFLPMHSVILVKLNNYYCLGETLYVETHVEQSMSISKVEFIY